MGERVTRSVRFERAGMPVARDTVAVQRLRAAARMDPSQVRYLGGHVFLARRGQWTGPSERIRQEGSRPAPHREAPLPKRREIPRTPESPKVLRRSLADSTRTPGSRMRELTPRWAVWTAWHKARRPTRAVPRGKPSSPPERTGVSPISPVPDVPAWQEQPLPRPATPGRGQRGKGPTRYQAA